MLADFPRTTADRGRIRPGWTAVLAAFALVITALYAASTPTGADRSTNTGAEVVRVAEFLAECPYSHRLPDDPIVAPGCPAPPTCTASSAAG